MDALLSCLRSHEREMTAWIRELVECESPSDNPDAVNRFVDVAAGKLGPLGRVVVIPGNGCGRHLQCEFTLPGEEKEGQILVLGHSDTVWPLGTLAHMPFRDDGRRLYGPGVLDMKAGIVLFAFAMNTLRDLGIPVRRRVLLQLNSDEEVGSDSSRELTEREARRSVAVLVLEPGTGLEGKLKTARKGVGGYKLVVHGKAAHAGLDFTSGASAILELARQIEHIAEFTNLERGTTVNPGVISGGTRTNVVAAEARAAIDIRALRLKDAAALDRKFHRLRPVDRRCTLEVSGGLNRPPMERTPAAVKLFRLAQKLAAEMGIPIEESTSGGGSDGNFTAALGVPTLDGLGAIGEGAHAAHESILVHRMADRAALLAGLVRDL